MSISNQGTQGRIQNPNQDQVQVGGHCDDCVQDYLGTRADHNLTCPARQCDVCLSRFTNPVEEDADGDRVCQECSAELAEGAFDRDSEEEDENGAT